jgi:hypothetical protein
VVAGGPHHVMRSLERLDDLFGALFRMNLLRQDHIIGQGVRRKQSNVPNPGG